MPAPIACQPVAFDNAADTAPFPAPPAAPAETLGLKLRSRLFNTLFIGSSFLFVLSAYPLLLWPTRRPVARAR